MRNFCHANKLSSSELFILCGCDDFRWIVWLFGEAGDIRGRTNKKPEVWSLVGKKKKKKKVCVCVCVCVLGSWWSGDLTSGKQKSLSLWNQRRLLRRSLWLESKEESVSQWTKWRGKAGGVWHWVGWSGGCTPGPRGLGSCRKGGVWCHYHFGSDRLAGAFMKDVPLGQSL